MHLESPGACAPTARHRPLGVHGPSFAQSLDRWHAADGGNDARGLILAPVQTQYIAHSPRAARAGVRAGRLLTRGNRPARKPADPSADGKGRARIAGAAARGSVASHRALPQWRPVDEKIMGFESSGDRAGGVFSPTDDVFHSGYVAKLLKS